LQHPISPQPIDIKAFDWMKEGGRTVALLDVRGIGDSVEKLARISAKARIRGQRVETGTGRMAATLEDARLEFLKW
jgi:predicted metal-dependent phosphotriesterase family hydrolase